MKFDDDANICQDISVKNTNVNFMMLLQENQ